VSRSRAVAIVHWVWERGDRTSAWGIRLLLLPLSLIYYLVMVMRAAVARGGERLPLPSVSVGNLTVGGAGKTPLAAWIAEWLVRHQQRPAILLRGYGGDEPLVHARLVPQALVVANPDRVRGAREALRAGASILVLDDAYQTLRVSRDLNIALLAVEQSRLSPFPLPAGPWRERWGALGRADAIIVTRKGWLPGYAAKLAGHLARSWPTTPVAIVHLALTGFEGLRSGQSFKGETLAGRRVLAAAGIADPRSFAIQLEELTGQGGAVQLVTYQDHHAYTDADIAALLNAAATADYVVVTEKDAVKLRSRWPADAREPLVATLGVRWERGQQAIEALLVTLTDSSTPEI